MWLAGWLVNRVLSVGLALALCSLASLGGMSMGRELEPTCLHMSHHHGTRRSGGRLGHPHASVASLASLLSPFVGSSSPTLHQQEQESMLAFLPGSSPLMSLPHVSTALTGSPQTE